MNFIRRKHAWFATLVFGLGIITGRWIGPHQHLTSVPAGRNADGEKSRNRRSPLATVAFTDRIASLSPPRDSAEPATVQSILTSVKTTVGDWRNYRPENYTVKALPDRPEVTFHLEQIKDEGAFTTWIGRSALPGESFVAVATLDGLDAIATTYDGHPVEIHIRGSRATAFESEGLPAMECGVGPISQSAILNVAGEIAPAVRDGQSGNTISAGTDAAGNYLSRVGCFYDAATLAFASSCAPDGDGTSFLNATFKARLEAGNVILANSQINVRWVYLASALAPTPVATAAMDVWNEVRGPGTVGDFMRQKATEWGATQVFLGYFNVTGNFTGYADLPGHYAVGNWNRNYLLMAHELAHNFGLNHDRYTDGALANPNNAVYSYAVNFAALNGSARQPVGTLMSYASYSVPYFSNASLTISSALVAQLSRADYSPTYQALPLAYLTGTGGNFYYGSPTNTVDLGEIGDAGSTAGLQPLGIPSGQPYAADASRTFRENASSTVSGGWYVSPSITRQPQNVAATTGLGFTLSVNTVGTGQTAYQWFKGSAAIPSATDSSFAVTSASAGDAASYNVVVTVSDLTGLVTTLTSNNATVTVNAAGNSGGSAGGGGGSGGGGSLTADFFWALLAIAIGRLVWRKNKREFSAAARTDEQ